MIAFVDAASSVAVIVYPVIVAYCSRFEPMILRSYYPFEIGSSFDGSACCLEVAELEPDDYHFDPLCTGLASLDSVGSVVDFVADSYQDIETGFFHLGDAFVEKSSLPLK